MCRITEAQTLLLRVPVLALKVDPQSTLEARDVLAVRFATGSGLEGWGYQCGFLGSDDGARGVH